MNISLLLLAIFFSLSLVMLMPDNVIKVKQRYLLLLLVVALLFFSGLILFDAVLALATLAGLMFISSARRYSPLIRTVTGGFAGIGVFAITLGAFPGFVSTPIVENVLLGTSNIPFTFKISYAKGMVGLLILTFWFSIDADGTTIKNKLWRAALPGFLLVLIFIVSSTFVGYSFDPKWYWFTPYFLMGNICLTVIAEEVFFRGVMQQKLMEVLAGYTRYAGIIALLVVSIFFGLLHLKGGATYAVLTTFAGLIYGWIYWRYKSLHAAILCHFGVNLLHFVFLKYPG